MEKITAATIKSFIRKNEANAFLRVKSQFDGLTDGIQNLNGGFSPLTKNTRNPHHERDLGFIGVWLVGSSRDYFWAYENDNFIGFEVDNCCGNWIIAVKK